MRLLSTSVLLLGSCMAFSQSVNVASVRSEIGRNLSTNQPIYATEFTFPERVHGLQINEDQKWLTINLRGIRKEKWLSNKGQVVRYHLDRDKVLWSKSVVYPANRLWEYGDVTIHSVQASKSTKLNNWTGEGLWETRHMLTLADPELKVGVGYRAKYTKKHINMLDGINLIDGQVIWEREIARDYGWNEVLYLNDSTLLAVAGGLHTIDLASGKGWSFPTVTGKKDYTASAVGSTLGLASALLTGYGSYTTGYNLLGELCSNVLVDSSSIYFASAEVLTRFSHSGELIWRESLQDDVASNSLLIHCDSTILMVNRGYGYMGQRRVPYGAPFVALFDSSTGERRFLNQISGIKEDQLQSFLFETDSAEVLAMLSDQIAVISTLNGEIKNLKRFDLKSIQGLWYFIDDGLYLEEDSSFVMLKDSGLGDYFVYVQAGEALALDQNLEIIGGIELDKLYTSFYSEEGITLIAKEDSTFAITEEGKVVAEMRCSSRASIENGMLYDFHENKIRRINLSDILPQD